MIHRHLVQHHFTNGESWAHRAVCVCVVWAGEEAEDSFLKASVTCACQLSYHNPLMILLLATWHIFMAGMAWPGDGRGLVKRCLPMRTYRILNLDDDLKNLNFVPLIQLNILLSIYLKMLLNL